MIRLLAAVSGLLALAVAAAGVAARYLPITEHPGLILAAAGPYLAVAAPAAVVLLVVGRRRFLTLVAVAVAAVSVGVYLPRFLGSAVSPAAAVDVRVLTANLGMGQADPLALAALARETADLVAVQELTQSAADGLSAAGMDDVFPYRVVLPAPRASGIGLWSRHPIAHSGRLDGYTLPMLGARIRIPGVAVDVTVLSVHLAAPWPAPIAQWRHDVALFPTTLEEVGRAAGSGAVIVAGDFNATADMAPFRRLLDAGYDDAAAEAGAGLARTFPGDARWPPLIGIDHILVRHCAAVSARTVVVPGSDHRGLLAAVKVPVDAPLR